MFYKGKAIEIVGQKEVFGKLLYWVRVLEDGTFIQVSEDDISTGEVDYDLPYIRFISLASKIKDEVARKNILAPYESSLIPLPHQILVLEKVMMSAQNRFLLADEVGMGKTIETGLILKELKLRGDIQRVLVIVPKSSILQWQGELKEHFNEIFHIYDSDMISSMARTFSNINADQEFNFWTQHNQIIVTTDALKPLEKRQGWSKDRVDEYNKYRIEAVLDADFDLVVIDEAHKMGGASSTVSRYVLAQELCNSVANVLLLTATPHRGKSDHFRRILQLLDPDAFAGEGLPDIDELEPYVIRTEKRHAVDYDGVKLFNDRETHRFNVILDLNKHQKQMMLYEAVTEYVRKGFNGAKKTNNSAVGLIMILFQRLVSSSTAAILSAMEGRLNRLRYGEDSVSDYTDDLDSPTEESVSEIDFEGLYQDDKTTLDDEEEILSNLIEQAKDCLDTEVDAKADSLLQKLQELKSTSGNSALKIIVFTEFRSTQQMLIDFFGQKGYSCSSINGSQDIDERKRELIQFKNENQILVATDAAGESLNMQFCHMVFNYDLPWNPMMIEQRIGRVDRIGQKKVVQAFNMLTNNSVDLRVYEVIEEKLNNIIHQLGIDKTSDVLDSTIDMKKVNQLYLQSLLDPQRFEFAGDKWLHEIQSKLRDFQSTEGILPQVKESSIDPKKASEVKHSPLPTWLKSLVKEYVKIRKGSVTENLLGYMNVAVDDVNMNVTFDSEVAIDNPATTQLSLQHDWIKSILNGIGEFDFNKGIPIVRFKNIEDTIGYWSLWQISASNRFESNTQFQCFFITENGKQYSAYANDLWTRLISDESTSQIEFVGMDAGKDLEPMLKDLLFQAYQNLEVSVLERMETKKRNKENSYSFQKSRIGRIGIPNIRESKLRKLEEEHRNWTKEFESNKRVIPSLKPLLTLKVDA